MKKLIVFALTFTLFAAAKPKSVFDPIKHDDKKLMKLIDPILQIFFDTTRSMRSDFDLTPIAKIEFTNMDCEGKEHLGLAVFFKHNYRESFLRVAIEYRDGKYDPVQVSNVGPPIEKRVSELTYDGVMGKNHILIQAYKAHNAFVNYIVFINNIIYLQ